MHPPPLPEGNYRFGLRIAPNPTTYSAFAWKSREKKAWFRKEFPLFRVYLRGAVTCTSASLFPRISSLSQIADRDITANAYGVNFLACDRSFRQTAESRLSTSGRLFWRASSSLANPFRSCIFFFYLGNVERRKTYTARCCNAPECRKTTRDKPPTRVAIRAFMAPRSCANNALDTPSLDPVVRARPWGRLVVKKRAQAFINVMPRPRVAHVYGYDRVAYSFLAHDDEKTCLGDGYFWADSEVRGTSGREDTSIILRTVVRTGKCQASDPDNVILCISAGLSV